MDEEEKVDYNNPDYQVDDEGEYDFTKLPRSKFRALLNKNPAHLSKTRLLQKESYESLI